MKGGKLVVGEDASSSIATLCIANCAAIILVRRRTSVREARRDEERLGRLDEVREYRAWCGPLPPSDGSSVLATGTPPA